MSILPDYHYAIGTPKYPVLNAFFASNARFSAIMGPLGSGKTYCAAQRILRHMVEQAPNAQGDRLSRWGAVRNTYPDLETTTIVDFCSVFSVLGEMKHGAPPTFHAQFRLTDGTMVRSQVIFLALDREDDVKKLRGTQFTGFWLNELKELVKSVVDMADMRHGRYPSIADGGCRPTWHGMLADLNAPDEDHWYYAVAEEERPEGWAFFRQPGGVTADGELPSGRIRWKPNPEAENLENLPERYYSEGVKGKSDDWISVNLANEYGFVSDGKAVHPEYVDSVHTSREDIAVFPEYPLILGVDFGRTPAAAICQYIEHADRWHCIDEFTSHDMSAALFAPALKAYLDRTYPGFAVSAYGDPAGDHAGEATEDTPVLIMRSRGIPTQPAPTNKVLLRRLAVTNALRENAMDGRPRLRISPKAKLIRKGLAGGFCYRRLKVSGDERYTDVPDKNMYSHPVEALEYALLGGGEGREALKPARSLGARRARQQTATM